MIQVLAGDRERDGIVIPLVSLNERVPSPPSPFLSNLLSVPTVNLHGMAKRFEKLTERGHSNRLIALTLTTGM